MDTIASYAEKFATVAHLGHFRKYTREPYIVHPAHVAELVASVGAPEEAIAAAWLHDVVEDCNVNMGEIDAMFPGLTSRLVEALTDPAKLKNGPNREERKERTRKRFLLLEGEVAIWAHTLKAADCLSNSISIKEHDPNFWKVFKAEVTLLTNVLTLAHPSLMDPLRELLEADPVDHSRSAVWK